MEGVGNVRSFFYHFKFGNVKRSGVDNLKFKSLSGLNKGDLVKPFSLEEVKHAVWNCDKFKSTVTDEINLGFIKNFWVKLKDD